MATSIHSSAAWLTPETTDQKISLWSNFQSLLLKQKQNHTLWFFLTLVVHGVLVLPVPAVLIYYYNAPESILAVTMICFFINMVANMGGAGIKTTISVFACSLIIHLALILAFVL